jgi:hypothetical protein
MKRKRPRDLITPPRPVEKLIGGGLVLLEIVLFAGGAVLFGHSTYLSAVEQVARARGGVRYALADAPAGFWFYTILYALFGVASIAIVVDTLGDLIKRGGWEIAVHRRVMRWR